MEVDSSLDIISPHDEFQLDEYKLDLADFISEEDSPFIENEQEDIRIHSPVKKQKTNVFSTDFLHLGPLLNNSRVQLQPDVKESHVITNELFQVTSNLRKSVSRESQDIFKFDDDSDFFPKKRLNNDKVEKLVHDLGSTKSKSGELFDFELDDQLRTRFYKGRFNKVNQFSIEQNDDVDSQILTYLGGSSSFLPKKNNDNKENLSPFPDPLKSVNTKENFSIKKSNKTFFRPPRRNQGRASIPVLKPLSNLANVDFKKSESPLVLNINSNKRLCSPHHRKNIAIKPSRKLTQTNHNIFVVESLTGLVNDATKFGTELNASSCEDFPLPEYANEIVQIPTNEDSHNKVQKMAIIKLVPNRLFSQTTAADSTTEQRGFYNAEQYRKYKEDLSFVQEDSGVEVIGQTLNNDFNQSSSSSHKSATPSNNTKKTREVHWPDTLEW